MPKSTCQRNRERRERLQREISELRHALRLAGLERAATVERTRAAIAAHMLEAVVWPSGEIAEFAADVVATCPLPGAP